MASGGTSVKDRVALFSKSASQTSLSSQHSSTSNDEVAPPPPSKPAPLPKPAAATTHGLPQKSGPPPSIPSRSARPAFAHHTPPELPQRPRSVSPTPPVLPSRQTQQPQATSNRRGSVHSLDGLSHATTTPPPLPSRTASPRTATAQAPATPPRPKISAPAAADAPSLTPRISAHVGMLEPAKSLRRASDASEFPQRYRDLFQRLVSESGGGGAVGDLSADAVAPVWRRSQLDDATLHNVWAAVDAAGRGRLGERQFCAGLAAIDGHLATAQATAVRH
ncbi:hypothetical protein RI367_007255 [Sorochytrium milnesiophthora]